jgi:hypothetical protein
MQNNNRIGVVLIWFAGLIFGLAAANKNDPYRIALRPGEHCSVRGEHFPGHCVDPVRLLAQAEDHSKNVGAAMVSAVAIDVVRAWLIHVCASGMSARSLGRHFRRHHRLFGSQSRLHAASRPSGIAPVEQGR